ncbi:MAG: hypothetical protein KTR16_00280 [Acidiferrobacterales bacterium]|nr:hypothetical protein [Acidiferrobacterales bacterium]
MEDIYKAPEAELQKKSNDKLVVHFPVSITKLWIISIATVGLYSLVWNYYHWRTLKYADETERDIWPVPRAIFSIFFVNALFKWFTESCERNNIDYKWQPSGMAALYIVTAILSNIFDQFVAPTNLILFFSIFIALLIGQIYSMAEAQKVANVAIGDPDGSANSSFTPANYLWLVIGLAFWALVIAGAVLPE